VLKTDIIVKIVIGTCHKSMGGSKHKFTPFMQTEKKIFRYNTKLYAIQAFD